MSKTPVHVTPHDDGWAIRREGASRASSLHRTQAEAIDAGRRTAGREHAELKVHGRDGHIRARDAYGNDRYPPRG